MLNEQVEPMILANLSTDSVPPPNWQRPFVDTTTSSPLSLPESQQKVVEFMEEDESMGDVSVNWLGPGPMDYRSGLALKLLGDYLTSSATAPLQKEFVEIPKPYCSSIGFYSEDRVNKNELSCFIADVPVKYGEKMIGMVVDKLKKIVSDEGIDMEKMALIIRRDKRKLLDGMETSVSSTLADCAIGGKLPVAVEDEDKADMSDFLYGDAQGKDLPEAFEDLREYDILSSWSSKDWLDLLERYYINQPSITTVGKPSAALSAKIESDEKERLAKRKAELGEDKLKQFEKDLEAAKAESDRPPPDGMISDFPITDVGLRPHTAENGADNTATELDLGTG